MTFFKIIPLNIPNLSISVEEKRHSPKPGPTLAYADARAGPVVIFGIAVVQGQNGGLFVGLPFNGEHSRRFRIITIDEEIKKQARLLVLEAWDELPKN
jgi:DNA-binding cell septation regulator SpoVG